MKSAAAMNPVFKNFLQQFTSFTPGELDRIDSCFRDLYIAKDKHLVREGQYCRHLAFIVKGLLRVYYWDRGKVVTRYLGMEPSFITSLSSFISQVPANENIEALEDSHLLILSYEDMQELCKEYHAWETLYRKVLEFMFMCTEERIRGFITKTAEQRYQVLCDERPSLIQRVPQKYIASYIGVAPQSLSRLQKTAYEKMKLANVSNRQ